MAAPDATRRKATRARRAADEVQGDTPALRLIALLEHIASRDQAHSLQSLGAATGLPKPTLHRMLQQLESAGLLQREGEGGRHYGTGTRLRALAESLLLNSSLHGARHQVLRGLVDELGESCNITALAGGEVVYLDRVETAAPLRFYLHPGSRVPVHCSASGKLFLAQMPAAQRRRLLQAAPLSAFTPQTLTALPALEAELADIKRAGHALDREEFLPGLVCVAVPVPPTHGTRSAMCIAVQAPAMRLPAARAAAQVLPALQRAAAALAAIDAPPTMARPRGAGGAKAVGRVAPAAPAKPVARTASAKANARGAPAKAPARAAPRKAGAHTVPTRTQAAPRRRTA